MSHTYDFLVFIGRFQPVHEGHLAVIRHALSQADKVIVLLGSAHQPATFRNPWSPEFREQLRSCLSADDNTRVLTAPLMDRLYNEERWLRDVQATVQHVIGPREKPPRIGLIGINQHDSQYYPSRFPHWHPVNAIPVEGASGTRLREGLFGDSDTPDNNVGIKWLDSAAAQALPEPVRHHLASYAKTPAFADLCAEHAFIRQYRNAWDAAPYTPMFITVDALVIQSGHLLLIERKGRPGKGLWALPGGFLDAHETIVDACLRELNEETGLAVSAHALRAGIRQRAVFDAPYRSARGRTVTHAFLIELDPSPALPSVVGGDDASRAFWLPLAELDPLRCFEDHYHIVQHLLGL